MELALRFGRPEETPVGDAVLPRAVSKNLHRCSTKAIGQWRDDCDASLFKCLFLPTSSLSSVVVALSHGFLLMTEDAKIVKADSINVVAYSII